MSGLLWVNSLPAAAAGAEPLKIIFDTDIDGDNDDVAAAAILHAFADAGQVEILAMGKSSTMALRPPYVILWQSVSTTYPMSLELT